MRMRPEDEHEYEINATNKHNNKSRAKWNAIVSEPMSKKHFYFEIRVRFVDDATTNFK